jgi:hypothetical protein
MSERRPAQAPGWQFDGIRPGESHGQVSEDVGLVSRGRQRPSFAMVNDLGEVRQRSVSNTVAAGAW